MERIRLIKELQDHCFLPLSVIKRVLKYEKGSPEREWFLQLHTDYFRPWTSFSQQRLVGEEQFRKTTGLGRRWLAKMEEWRIITPEIRNGQKIYSQDDLTLGKVVVDMDRIGLGPKDGFDPEALKVYRDMFRDIVIMSHRYYWQSGLGKLSPAEHSLRLVQSTDIMGVFFYHLYRKLSREVHERWLCPSWNPKQRRTSSLRNQPRLHGKEACETRNSGMTLKDSVNLISFNIRSCTKTVA